MADVAATAFSDAVGRIQAGADVDSEASKLIAFMTVDEKLACLDGDIPFWPGIADMMSGGYTTHPWPAAKVDRLGIPGLDFVDGPRGCVVGPATTFPVSMARGASFDPLLEERIGRAIGLELRAVGATFTGAVCMNLLRHPAWGRAQETYGEDPHHVGIMATALTLGLQQHVMACMKHFALNSMENARFKVDVTADERTLHEVYLPHFKRVAESGVASVMSAYNSVNGQWAGDNHELLTTILRDEWGWDGFVITDFIAGLRDPLGSIRAGCNIEMPFAQQRSQVVDEAVASGDLPIDVVDKRVNEIIATFLRFAHVFDKPSGVEILASAEHRQLAREAAVSSTVLLTNDGLLPLQSSSLTKLAVLGPLASVTNLGDAGSSNVLHTPDPVSPLDGIRAALPGVSVEFAAEDVSVCADADAVIVIVGFTKHDEGEYLGDGLGEVLGALAPPLDHPVLGSDDPAVIAALSAMSSGNDKSVGMGSAGVAGGDRDSLRLSPADEQRIDAACAANDRVVVVVVSGSTVVMPWLDTPSATIMTWYAGSEGGTALADVLLGSEPGGRLPFAVPTDEIQLVPFQKDAYEATYTLLHGQWLLDANNVAAHLPFGHGLSYAEFELGKPEVVDGRVVALISNTSDVDGSTVVFVFGSVPQSLFERPPRRLIGFAKASIAAGSSELLEVELELTQLDIRQDSGWLREDQPVVLHVGFDAADTIML